MVAGHGKGAYVSRELNLEHHQMIVPERHLGTREIEFPHPAESLVVQRCSLSPILAEARTPFFQRLCVMQAQRFDIGDVESAAESHPSPAAKVPCRTCAFAFLTNRNENAQIIEGNQKEHVILENYTSHM